MTPMTTMIVTKATGAMTMPIGMTVAAPECEMTGTELMNFANGAAANSIFFANLISAFAAHERCGVHLYRAAAGMTQFPDWRDKYEEFLEQTENHVRILADLTTQMGGNPMYISPQARMTEFVNSKLMEPILFEGSVDRLTVELTTLEAVLLAENKCHSNWELLKTMGQRLPDSSLKSAIQQAVEQVEDQEDEHVRWAKSTWQEMILAQVTAAQG